MKIWGGWSEKAVSRMVARGMTITELAEEIGLSRRYVSMVVRGKLFSEVTRKKIEKALDMEEGNHDGGSTA